MTTLHIIRHGETEWNIAGRMQGHQDSPLTQKGREQAALARSGVGQIDSAYASPSARALETARIILNDPDYPVETHTGLMELKLGVWEGKKRSEVEKTHAAEFDIFWNRPSEFKLDQAETFQALQDRAVTAIHEIIEKERGNQVLVVTHTATIKVIMAYFAQIPMDRIWEPPFIGNGSHSVIQVDSIGQANVTLYSGQTEW